MATITLRTATAIEDTYSAEVDLSAEELAVLRKVKTALDQAREDYDLPRMNPRPIIEISES